MYGTQRRREKKGGSDIKERKRDKTREERRDREEGDESETQSKKVE